MAFLVYCRLYLLFLSKKIHLRNNRPIVPITGSSPIWLEEIKEDEGLKPII